ncbi:class A beta-lactamase-related serine hydrolase [Pedobacter polaris]|uniref:Class A beta-lactamase-related serine hydrolase n=2 Tax=Pedobacter polaris TaxID=2571273 RepID=A0A4U1CSY0_9SPHI|nr:class A beta-lactamase-related serine hydrolase [Pedobacter polaris]
MIIALPILSRAQLTTSDNIDVFIKSKMQQRNIPALQIAVVRSGKVVKLSHYGTANLEYAVPATDQTVFPINSITKAFVGVAIMQLAEEGKLKIHDPISKYLDSLPVNWQSLTLQQLLTHTSGLPDIIDEDEQVFGGGEQAAWKRVTSLPLLSKPGEKFSYNQTGYVALGKIITKLSGMHFTKFITEKQFKIAGMPLTRFGDSYDVVPNSAGAYTMYKMVNGNFIRNNTPGISYIQFPEFYRTAAGIMSTAQDMANWIIALKDGRLLKEQPSIETMFTAALLNNGKIGGFNALTNGYALGWPTVTRSDHPAVAPVGGGRNALFVYLKDDLSIVILTNLMGSSPERMIDEIAGYYINDMHEANGFGLPVGIKKLRAELLKKGFEHPLTTVESLKKKEPAIDLNEQDLNAWAYQLLAQKDHVKALAIFQLNTILYPTSANVYDSLAEIFEVMENQPAALINYKKVLVLDPGNKNAIARIKALSGK